MCDLNTESVDIDLRKSTLNLMQIDLVVSEIVQNNKGRIENSKFFIQNKLLELHDINKTLPTMIPNNDDQSIGEQSNWRRLKLRFWLFRYYFH